MKNWIKKALPSVGLLGCLTLSGCLFVDDDDDDSRPVGTLTVQWTIDGQTNPRDCAFFDVDRLELLIYYRGELVDEVEPFCEDFAVSIDMLEGRYDADATMVDVFDQSATIPEPLDDLDVVGGTELVVDLDFPVDSFL